MRVFKVLGGLSAGQTIVIDGAAGGVGAAAVQLAKARGARVIGTASERNHEFLRSLTSLGLKEAKDLVEAAPKAVLEKVNKEAADKAKEALEGAGATVTLK